MAEAYRDKSPSIPRSREDITLSDIPEDEIVDYTTTSTGKEMIIYTMDEQGLMFPLEPGASVAELLPLVVSDLGLSHEADEMFALWLMSPLLEIQLKSHHVPFRISSQWEDLLIKFTNAPEEDICRDEPILMFRRHAMLSRSREKYVEDPKILELLYFEAERNIVNERCPLDVADYHQMAGLSSCVRFGTHDPSVHTQKFYRDHLEEVYPTFLFAKKKSTKQQMVELFTIKHREASQRYGGDTQEEKWQLQKVYLQHCWDLPYYGSTIFHGQIETPTNGTLGKLSNIEDTLIYVTVNREGIFVLDKTKVTVLLSLLYTEFCWEYAEPCDLNNRNCLPCLFLHFHDNKTTTNGTTKLLQVFSRQAVMMDALIKASKSSLTAETPSGGSGELSADAAMGDGIDSVDGPPGSRRNLDGELKVGEVKVDFKVNLKVDAP